MPSYEQVNAQADAEMSAFLAAQNPTPSDTPPPAQPDDKKPSINEDDFIDDEDELGGQENPNQQQSYQTAQPQQEQTQTQTQTPTMYTAEQLEYERRLAEERGRNAAYSEWVNQSGQQQYQPQQTQTHQPFITDDMIEFTPEEQEKYSEEAYTFASKVANRAIKNLIDQVVAPLQQQVAQQAQTLQTQGMRATEDKARTVSDGLHREIPDLKEIVKSSEWLRYINGPDPFDSTRKLGDVFLNHLYSGRANDARNIIDAFRRQHRVEPAQSQMSPGQSSVGNPPTTLPNRKNKMLSYDKFLEKQRLWQSGMISYEEYAQVEAMYDRAAMEGRVKY